MNVAPWECELDYNRIEDLEWSWILLGTLGYCWILLDTVGYAWILLDSLGFSWILSDNLGHSRTLSDSRNEWDGSQLSQTPTIHPCGFI